MGEATDVAAGVPSRLHRRHMHHRAAADRVFFDKSDPFGKLIPHLTPTENYFGV
jgi:hypothetical protein